MGIPARARTWLLPPARAEYRGFSSPSGSSEFVLPLAPLADRFEVAGHIAPAKHSQTRLVRCSYLDTNISSAVVLGYVRPDSKYGGYG